MKTREELNCDLAQKIRDLAYKRKWFNIGNKKVDSRYIAANFSKENNIVINISELNHLEKIEATFGEGLPKLERTLRYLLEIIQATIPEVLSVDYVNTELKLRDKKNNIEKSIKLNYIEATYDDIITNLNF